MSKILDQAIQYAKLNFYIFPCREIANTYIDNEGKTKLAKEKSPYTKDGFKNATTDITQIEKWWYTWKNACIGIACEPSNLFVIDIDIKNNKNAIDNYMQLGIIDTEALHSKTPSGGMHIVFSGQGKTTTNSETGIDTRGNGGYFIAPPSMIIKDDIIKRYIALDNWNRIPAIISEYDMEKLHIPIKKEIKQKKYIKINNQNISTQNIEKIKVALDNLPMHFVNEYQSWIEIGFSLYELQDVGRELWINWSKKSLKFNLDECLKKWETFDPKEITLGSLFYWKNNNG